MEKKPGMRKKSFSAFASISRVAKQNLQLTPKSKPRKDGGRGRRRRHSHDDSVSSSASSFDDNSSYSDVSESDSGSSSYSEESKVERYSRSRKDKGNRRHRSRGDKRNYNDRDKRRARRRDRDRYSPDPYGAPKPHLKNPNAMEDDAAQMIDLLMRILPFYGKGDVNSDAVVVDTIHRLPPHALEIQDTDGNTLIMLACQAGAFNLMPMLLSKGCNVNTRNNVGASCLHFACFVDTFSPDGAMALIRHGAVAEVAENEFGCTPLHWAAFAGHVELCATLCRAGGKPVTLDKNGCDPIHYSKQNGHTACTQLLESFSVNNARTAKSVAPGVASPTSPSDSSDKDGWVRCLDGGTGTSFYHNRDTGESLWGDDFRNVDEADEPAVADIKPPPKKDKSKYVKTDDKKEEVAQLTKTRKVVSETDPRDRAPETNNTKQVPPGEIDLDTCQHVPIHGMVDTLSIKPIEDGKLTAIAEDAEEASTRDEKVKMDTVCEQGHAPLNHAPDVLQSETESQLADIDMVETSSVEDVELSQTTTQPDSSSKEHKKVPLSRLNSWDADFYTEEELKIQHVGLLPVEAAEGNRKVGDSPSTEEPSAEASVSQKEPGEASSNRDATMNDPFVIRPSLDSNSAKDPPTSIARNQSFEERISSLHQRMESSMLHRLQHLEDKITQQNKETSMKVDDGKLKDNVAEMASTIFELRNEVGTKDLEVLSLKQKIVKMETDKISELKGSMNACVGEGNVHDGNIQADNEQLLAAKACDEQEIKDAKNEIARLKDQIDQTNNSLNIANGRYEQAQRHLEIAEQFACDEKASRSSMRNLLDQAQKGDIDSASLQQEEAHLAEETIIKLKEQIRAIGDKALEEKNAHQEELGDLNSKIAQFETDIKQIRRMHEASSDESEQLKEELNGVSSELGNTQEQLKEVKMAKMELMMAKDEAVDAMENALGKARSAEIKLQDMTDLVKKTEDLQRTNEQLNATLLEEIEKRKVLHNTLEDMKGRIRVYVRVRPLSLTETKAKYVNVMTKEDERTCVMAGDAATASDVRDWEFDKIFYGTDTDGNTQENVFKDTSLLITSAIDGFNVCIFAYGQTGSGKTYTMLGAGDGGDPSHQGLAPRVAHELFRKLAEKDSSFDVEVTASMLEIYTDKLRDLLAANKKDNECLGDLKIHLAEHTSSGLVEVEGAKIERVVDARELLHLFDRGTKGRASSSTKMNAESSRSHMIASIVLCLRNKRTGKIIHGKLTLVDLAGSERVSKSGATGHQLKEAQSINKSLSALGDVIGALTKGGRQHIPYRNHPLTMLMSDSIGGNAKTLMFVCCSPADYNRKETANSLDFAKRCRNVKNAAVVSKGSDKGAESQIRALRAELSKIKDREKGKGAVKRRPVGMRRPGM